MKKALITGIEGFTGRYLATELANAGYVVYGLSSSRTTDLPNIVECDICDAVAMQRAVADIQPDVVCHLAAIAFVAHGDVDAIYRTNIMGSRNLLEALVRTDHPVQSVLLASSANVYGNATGGMLDEQTPASPANDYAVSKLAMEYVARLYSERLPVVLVRPFNYTGLGQSESFLLPKIVSHVRRRAPVIELGNLDVVRDFSDVRTVVRCYRLLLDGATRGQIFNICSGQGHSLKEVLALAAELSGHAPEIRVNPQFVRANEVKSLIGSKAALERQIGPVENFPLRETLAWMLG